jgi:hypothetical protein
MKLSLELIKTLANQARIETVYENGEVISYFIPLKLNSEYIRQLGNSEHLNKFKSIIESRLTKRDFIDTRPPELIELSPFEDEIVSPSYSAERVVMSQNLIPIFNWSVQQNSDTIIGSLSPDMKKSDPRKLDKMGHDTSSVANGIRISKVRSREAMNQWRKEEFIRQIEKDVKKTEKRMRFYREVWPYIFLLILFILAIIFISI